MKYSSDRRTFIKASALIASTAVSPRLLAQAPIVADDDPTGLALGYKANHADVDVVAYPKKAAADGANQKCASCALYAGIDSEYGNCPIFPGKRVHANGWCNSYVKK